MTLILDPRVRSAFLALWSDASSGARRNYRKADWLELEQHLADDDPAARALALKLYQLGDAIDAGAWKILAAHVGLAVEPDEARS